MPIFISGKVLDEFGSPINHTAVIKEIPVGTNIGSADAWTNADGTFFMTVLSPASLIEIEAVGYEPQFFNAGNVPSEIKLNVASGLIINGTTTKKKDNTLLYILGGLGLAAIGYATLKKPVATAKPAPVKKGLGVPANVVKVVL